MLALANDLRETGHEHIPPHSGGELRAIANIGYSAEQALADLIDNSIDAESKHVSIRLYHEDDALVRIVTADNGCGMSEETLRTAMQFGADMGLDDSRLGKYGIGLKAASFGQCSTLSVLTRSGEAVCGRRWTARNIESGWNCVILDPEDVERELDVDWGAASPKNHGTLVVWDDIRRSGVRKKRSQRWLENLIGRIKLHLSIVFHRFLDDGSCHITIETETADGDRGLIFDVEALDPFKTPGSGAKDYPRQFRIDLGEAKLESEAVIWPARRNEPEYRLGRNAAARQGLYFYRNDRLIQIAGWNGLRRHESEPHMSLARIAVELPASLDDLFRLNVQKSGVEVPESFLEGLRNAELGVHSFQDYINLAKRVYDLAEEESGDNVPLAPGRGVTTSVRRTFLEAFEPEADEYCPISFVWRKLASEKFFEIDREGEAVLLNSRYRSLVTKQRKRSPNDLLLVKGLLFVLFRDVIDSGRYSKKQKDLVRATNRILLACVGRES